MGVGWSLLLVEETLAPWKFVVWNTQAGLFHTAEQEGRAIGT